MPVTLRRIMPVVLLSTLAIAGCHRGFSGWQVVRGATNETEVTSMKTVYVKCPSGKMVLGGGAVVGYQLGGGFPTDPNGILMESEPTGDATGWQATGIDLTPGHSWAVIAYAICADVH